MEEESDFRPLSIIRIWQREAVRFLGKWVVPLLILVISPRLSNGSVGGRRQHPVFQNSEGCHSVSVDSQFVHKVWNDNELEMVKAEYLPDDLKRGGNLERFMASMMGGVDVGAVYHHPVA